MSFWVLVLKGGHVGMGVAARAVTGPTGDKGFERGNGKRCQAGVVCVRMAQSTLDNRTRLEYSKFLMRAITILDGTPCSK
jgi:hypothetical protein